MEVSLIIMGSGVNPVVCLGSPTVCLVNTHRSLLGAACPERGHSLSECLVAVVCLILMEIGVLE